MLKNYLLVALRSFRKQKVYGVVNMVGLTIALAVAILAIIFIRHELSYDTWLPGYENIYKVYRQWEPGRGTGHTPSPLAEVLRMDFPEVQYATGAYEYEDVLVSTADRQKSLYIKNAAFADSSFLQVLPFPLKYGDAATALQQPLSALLSNELAHTLFGQENPVGKVIVFNNSTDFQVTGVLEPNAGNSHFQADIILRDTTFIGDNWSGNNLATFVALHKGADIAALEKKITANINPRIKAEINDIWDKYPDWRLQSWSAIHLNEAHVSVPYTGKGSMRMVYIIGLVALVVLAIATINYINLATAQATRRALEVGVRKVTGATHQQLIGQFLAEAWIQALIALPLAMLLADLVLPAFNSIINRELVLDWATWKALSVYLLVLVTVLGLLAGAYPALFLSAYHPSEVLKGQWLRKDRGRLLRHGMVVTQFTGAMVVAIVMFFIYWQVQYMQQQELGFQPEQVLVVKANTSQTYQKIKALKQQLLQSTHINSISATSTMPGERTPDYSFHIEGEQNDPSVDIYFTDAEYMDVLGLTMKQGRFLSDADTTANTFVVNEAFVKEYNLKDPIGHHIKFSGMDEPGEIIGVMQDFHVFSLTQQIEPLVISGAISQVVGGWIGDVAFQVSSQDMHSTLAEIEQFWKQIEPEHPMRYTFLDDDFSRLYTAQQQLGQTLLYATLLTLLIAIMGLFGLASYMAEQRTKEIGVRKVLGASVPQIVVLMGKDFLKLVLIADAIAVPIAFWLAKSWLSGFAYHMNMTWLPFVLVILLAVLIAFLTVSMRAIRAAKVNPVESLRSE